MEAIILAVLKKDVQSGQESMVIGDQSRVSGNEINEMI
jgi:hypothetical protein